MARVAFYTYHAQSNHIIVEKENIFNINFEKLHNNEVFYLQSDWYIADAADSIKKTFSVEFQQLSKFETQPLVLQIPPSDYTIHLLVNDKEHMIQPDMASSYIVPIEAYPERLVITLDILDVAQDSYIFYEKPRLSSVESDALFDNASEKLAMLFLIPLIINLICAIFVYFFVTKSRIIIYVLGCFAFAFIYELFIKSSLLFHIFHINSLMSLKLLSLSSVIYILLAIFLVPFYLSKPIKQNRRVRTLTLLYSSIFFLIAFSSYSYYPVVQLIYIGLFIMTVGYVIWFLARLDYSLTKTIFLGLIIFTLGNGAIWQSLQTMLFFHIPIYPIDYLIIEMSLILLLTYQYNENNKKLASTIQQLQQANQLKNNFMRENTETLNKPFHKMIALTNELSTHANEHELQLLHQLKLEQKNAYHVILEKLDYVSLIEGDIVLEQKEIDLTTILRNTLELLQELIIANNVHVQMTDLADAYYTLGDERRFGQIYYYLIRLLVTENYGGTIQVAMRAEQDSVSITFSGQLTKEKEEIASSISYFVCKELVERQGGQFQLAIEQQTVTFSIQCLKTSSTPLAQPWQPITSSAHTKQHTQFAVLFLTDDVSYLELGHTLLDEQLYVIDFARHQDEIEHKLFSAEWDLLIIDSALREVQSEALIKWIRTHFTTSELPILYLTWHIDFQYLPDTLALGINDYLVKPLIPIELKYRAMNLLMLKKTLEEQQELEHSLLSTQIEPHFLFNTLNAIASLSEIDQDKMIDLLHHFGNYLQSSFSEKMRQRLVPLKTELALVKSYIAIEELRFAPNLFIMWDIDKTVNIYVPPFTIQTLVENAIRHGIRQKDGPGTVCIIVRRDQETPQRIHIEIADDGVGMSGQTIDRLLDGQQHPEHGIGIFNTNSRLKRTYGQGLHIFSEEQGGTVVHFSVDESKQYV